MNKLITPLLILSAMAIIADEMVVKTEPVTPAVKTALFNGKDLSGWIKVINKEEGCCPDKTWSVKNGIISCTGQPFGYLMTQQSYANYKLHVEYRWSAKAEQQNSGIFIHKTGPDNFFLPKSIETQLKDGNAGDFVLLSKATLNGVENTKNKRIERIGKPSEKPFGEWNSVEIIIRGNTIKSSINGVLQNEGKDIYTDAGNICLQSEGGPIEFRNITIEPLD
ncbi:MAG: DUF1080 domain-containing protein [Kiritimatiellae bacterium]|jgi:hypothetical protein|nr:DUF1080 domain-containing protein [Kiritimatiellia bacterium]